MNLKIFMILMFIAESIDDTQYSNDARSLINRNIYWKVMDRAWGTQEQLRREFDNFSS